MTLKSRTHPTYGAVYAQPSLFPDAPPAEDPRYLAEQLITYIGNKRSLLGSIGRAVDQVQHDLGGRKLRTLDAFSGSGVVSRFLKGRSEVIYANDIEDYARVVSECYLQNASDIPWEAVEGGVRELESIEEQLASQPPGFFERLYAPEDESNIRPGERVFYTRANARRLDAFRRALDRFDERVRLALLGPLLAEASIHANTAGVFKGFYKDKASGIGRYGGTGSDALVRIRGSIRPQLPVYSRFDSQYVVFQTDANELWRQVDQLDLAYIDPPYNQHPYGSNYFMLNLLVTYQEPSAVSRVSGIPEDWRRSDYNVRNRAAERMSDLVGRLDSKYLLVSFNDEGFIAPEEMRRILGQVGTIVEYAIEYNTYRGSRNLAGRDPHVTEHMYLVKKG